MSQTGLVRASSRTGAEASRKEAFLLFTHSSFTFPGAVLNALHTLTPLGFKTVPSMSAIFIPRSEAEVEVPSSPCREHNHEPTSVSCWATGDLSLLVGSRGRQDSLGQNQGPECPILALQGQYPQGLMGSPLGHVIRHPGTRGQNQQQDPPPRTNPGPQPQAGTAYLIGSGAGEAAESLRPTHGGLQPAALDCGAGVHPYWAVPDRETRLERRNKGTGLNSAC